jgi:transposase
MSKPYIVDKKISDFIFKIVETTKDADDLKRALCVVLSSELSLSADQVSTVLRIGRRTVFRYRDEICNIYKGKKDPRLDWGGRRRFLLTEEQEKNFFAKWEEKALKGELVDVKAMHSDLMNVVGHPIATASIYNLLERNGWRKLAPDKSHPKGSPAAREEFKKKLQKCWFPPSKNKIH